MTIRDYLALTLAIIAALAVMWTSPPCESNGSPVLISNILMGGCR